VHNKESVPPATINEISRDLLRSLRGLLLEQHKLLLDRERAQYEKARGSVGGPGQFLQLVIGDPHFAWLRQISTLIVEIDEAVAARSKGGQAEADALVVQARELMKPREAGSDFQQRYYQAVQESPDVVILHCKIEQLLGT
jgi:hypothetical protein